VAVGVNIVSEFDSKGIKRAIADFKKLEGAGAKATYGLRTFDSAAVGLAKSVAKFGAIAAGAAGVIGYNLIQAASGLEEAISKVNVVFGQSSDAVHEFASQSAVNLGISRQAALEAAGTYGNLFQAFGVGRERSQEMSTSLVQLAADLASFNNATIDDALQALRSGLSGETEPLKRFGVALNDVRLKQEALSMGLYNGKGNLDVAAKAQAAYALILKDTSLAQGDFARTSDGVANQQRILAAQFADVRAEIGTALLPVYKTLLGFINDQVLPRFREFADAVGKDGLGGGLRVLGGAFLDVTSSSGKMKDAIMLLTAAFVTFRGIAIAAAISQQLFNVALFANPIGIVVAAMIALGVAVVTAYLRFEKFRDVANKVINVVLAGLELLVNAFIGLINSFIQWGNMFNGVFRALGINIGNMGYLGEVSFGRIGDAAAKTNKTLGETVSIMQQIRNAERRQVTTGNFGGGTPPPVPTGGAARAIETAKEKLQKYTDALKGSRNAERSVRDAIAGTVKARKDLTSATQKVADAQEHFNRVTRGYARDSKEALDAMRDVTSAQKRLRDANLSLDDAVRGVADAERRLFDLRNKTADPESVAEAERSLERRKYDVEQANFAVIDAENELAALRLDPNASPQAVREAEIRLAESKLDVVDAVIAVRNAERQLDQQRTLAATPEEIADAERELARAKISVQDATDAQTEATAELATAEFIYTQVIEGAKEGSEAYKDALDKLNAAREAEVDASEAVTDALEKERDATDALREAKEKLRDVGSTVGNAIVERATRRFNETLPNFGTSFEPVATTVPDFFGGQTIINNNITAGMGADANELAQVIVDNLRTYERANGYIPVTTRYAVESIAV
jgi:hypothetical protein